MRVDDAPTLFDDWDDPTLPAAPTEAARFESGWDWQGIEHALLPHPGADATYAFDKAFTLFARFPTGPVTAHLRAIHELSHVVDAFNQQQDVWIRWQHQEAILAVLASGETTVLSRFHKTDKTKARTLAKNHDQDTARFLAGVTHLRGVVRGLRFKVTSTGSMLGSA